MHPDFAEYLLKKKVGNHWDLHLINTVQEYRGWGAVVFPEAITHSIHPEMPGMGSGRFTYILGEHEDACTEYVLLNLNRCWRVPDRVRTMVWAMMLAISHRVALVVLWRYNKGCEAAFHELLPKFVKKQKNLLRHGKKKHAPGVADAIRKGHIAAYC